MEGEVFTQNQAINARDVTAVGCLKIDDDAFLSVVFPGCDTGADT